MNNDASTAATKSLDSKAQKGALWSGLNVLITRVAGIAITVVVVRIVTPHDFGIFAAALIIHTIVSSFAELGVASCIARRDLSLEDNASTVTAISLTTGTAFAVMVYVFSAPIAALLGAPEAEEPVQILSICVFLTGVFAVPGALMTRDFRQDRLFIANLTSFVPANGLLIWLALDGNGAVAFAWSRVLGQLIVGLVILGSVRQFFTPRIDRSRLVPILKFGLPLAGANLINYTLLNADFAFIGRLLGPAVLGIYVLAFNVASWSSSVLGSTINSVAMTAFSEGTSDPADLRKRLGRWVRLTALVACPIAALTVILATDIIIALYGEKWVEAGGILSVLAVYGAIFTLSLVLSNLLVAKGESLRVFLIQLCWLAVLLPAMWLGINLFGVVAAAWVHVVVIAFVVIPLYLAGLRAVVPQLISLLLRESVGPLLTAFAAAAAALLVTTPISGPWPRIIVGATTGLCIYLVAALPLTKDFWNDSMTSKFGHYFLFYRSIQTKLLRLRRRYR